ncbi:hypothetical protein SAMN05421730_100291 [Anaerobium acetethylicum]|uniref:Uncharacterized protein n=1 Tax=Anaerobium acetethylicum TaxID=1619234 RepID=A0A1D3TQ75_9FIRM|nr:hypothetical protein SAMN05421730_100291 [Anaerobium acetethylicum]
MEIKKNEITGIVAEVIAVICYVGAGFMATVAIMG